MLAVAGPPNLRGPIPASEAEHAHEGHEPPHLYLLPPSPRTAPSPDQRRRAVYRRRRLAAFAVLASLALAGRWVLAGPGGGPLAAPEPGAPAQAPAALPPVHIVSPGETWWSIARGLQPSGDIRPLIKRMAAIHGPGPLLPGQRIELSAHP